MISLVPWKPLQALRPKGRWLVLPLVCLPAFAVRGMAAWGPHGSVELISEQAFIQPGRAFHVGLHFQLEKGWHIYWLNPGDSGEPPRVQWSLPTGFHAGPLEWPTPQRLPDHSLIDYGYEDEVLLLAVIHPPTHLAAGNDARLGANVSWLVCRETCTSRRSTLTLALPVGPHAEGELSSRKALFRKASEKFPTPAPQEWKLTGTLDGGEFVIEIETGRREAGATFFPLEPNQIENAGPQDFRPLPRGIQLRLRRSEQLLKPIAALAGVLVLDSGQSYVTKVPIRASE